MHLLVVFEYQWQVSASKVLTKIFEPKGEIAASVV